jgi:hypothetical protein
LRDGPPLLALRNIDGQATTCGAKEPLFTIRRVFTGVASDTPNLDTVRIDRPGLSKANLALLLLAWVGTRLLQRACGALVDILHGAGVRFVPQIDILSGEPPHTIRHEDLAAAKAITAVGRHLRTQVNAGVTLRGVGGQAVVVDDTTVVTSIVESGVQRITGDVPIAVIVPDAAVRVPITVGLAVHILPWEVCQK